MVKSSRQIAWLGPHSPSPPVHVHDNVEDSFEVVEGRLDVKLDGTWRTYGPGERAAAAPGHRHTLRNSHDEPVRFINRHRPAADNEGFFRDMASLASTGRMGAGIPHSPRQAIYVAMLFKLTRPRSEPRACSDLPSRRCRAWAGCWG